ncbi:MAG: hypothetical protein H7A23_12675 [Leptospiraceae bacterium]|nr:hypothetical protein [Leptospiraceae bacterium]MCP5495404.1 hypothetical protein [Leptospiraceae bacterium]
MDQKAPSYSSYVEKLDDLMTRPIPSFKEIETTIDLTPPAVLSSIIQEDAGFTYLLDYYLRFIDAKIVKKILQNPMFAPEALMELFSCQITNYHKAILLRKPPPELLSSYWAELGKAQYLIIFKYLIKSTTDFRFSKVLFEKIDLIHLKMMTSSGAVKSENVLRMLKDFGSEFRKIATHDINLYEYAFNLAMNQSDIEFLEFLDEYTVLFVQLRAAMNFVEELEEEGKKTGQIPTYSKIFALCNNIPSDTLKVSLELFEQKGWITSVDNKNIDDYYTQKNNPSG